MAEAAPHDLTDHQWRVLQRVRAAGNLLFEEVDGQTRVRLFKRGLLQAHSHQPPRCELTDRAREFFAMIEVDDA
jgi:hypothetical protein